MARTFIDPRGRTTVDSAAVVARRWRGHPGVNAHRPDRVQRPWWLWPHLLGLDAPLVALAWQDWWSRAEGVRLPLSQRAVLGLGVWMIYLADRLADTARSLPDDSATARHAFARTWRGPLSVLTVAVGVALVMLTLFTLPPGQVCGGLVLLAAASVYFWLIHRRGSRAWTARVPKEAAVGLIFAVGTAFFVLCRPSLPTARLGVAILLFGIACFLNCAFITSWERNIGDLRDPSSFLNAFPTLATRGLQPFCWWLAGITSAAGLAMHTTMFSPVVLGVLFLGMLDRCRLVFSREAMRFLADVVLLTPWICNAVLAMIQ